MTSTIRSSSLSPTITQTNLGDAIKSAFTAMGYNASNLIADTVISATRNIIYEKVFDSTKIFGKIQFRIQISSGLVVTQTLQTAWNSGTNTATSAGTSSGNFSFSSATGIQFRSFQSDVDEHNILCIVQGSTIGYLGWIRPATLNQIDENAFPAALQINAANSRKLHTAALTPYGTSGTNTSFTIPDIQITTANHYNQRDIIPQVPIVSDSGRGIYGVLSDDWALAGATGLAQFEQISSWHLLVPSSSSSGLFLK